MKTLLIWPTLLLLTGCMGMFSETPQSVIRGQRAIYQAITLDEENDNKIINRYVEDCKAAITYHINYVFEPTIEDIRNDTIRSEQEKAEQIQQLEAQRQEQLDEAYANIDRIANEMRATVTTNHDVMRKLVEAVHSYLSTTPIQVDDIDFLIERLNKSKQ